ncbi:MafI family immunity protein [Enterobacter hormaechei]|uniref:MafI family immunity protein n=1 Tax=Enterobacter hormaechei TaxID=158836 RepID=UPI0019826969|nr:MafI family immunity protein [Enterobacter hormaechei]EKS6646090.1 MafI family immunity protein [Enterobacter hormaechei]MBN4834183.1 MafI family immunity protein [Enterobacter hormaechei]MCP3815512.1 MafI family immunity protein [Enterobacter hormaechei]MCP3826277.1 MafI family immunity protein [Enterobacter hormaechei]MCW4625786.1 MafI family immunity protein [Enterobacter hormaechei]
MDINEKIRLLGEGLKDRLDPSMVDFALDYIGFSENILAFETLCDHIGDHDVVISKCEYAQIIEIANYLNLEINSRYTYINPEK